MSVTFLIVDPFQSCVRFIRSGVIRCTLLMVLYLDRMCQCGLHAVLWSHNGTLMHRLAAEPCSTAGLLFHSRCTSGMILLTPYPLVWDWRVSRARPMLLYWPKLLYPYYSLLLFFPFSSLSLGCYCGAGVFGLIGCILPYETDEIDNYSICIIATIFPDQSLNRPITDEHECFSFFCQILPSFGQSLLYVEG